MPAARRMNFTRPLSALISAIVILSCGGGDSTGPGGGNGVTVTPNPDTVALGSTVTLHASVGAGSGSPSFFWSSENTSIATVSGTGIVTGISLGSVRIAASSGGKSGVATVVVIPPGVSSVRVTPTLSSITVGGTVHLQAQPLDASGNPLDGRTVTWSSDNQAAATVDNSGVVTGVATGTANITATSEGKTGTAGINVGAAVAASITVAPPSVTITTGQSSQLTPTVKDASGNVISGAPVTWSVDNSGVALVSSTGLVAGQSAGTATVTATSGAAHTNVPITVTLPPANTVIVSPSTVSLLITQRQQLSATVTDAGGNPIPNQTVTWQSSDPTVATVGTTGLVIALLPGTATITGTSGAASGTSHVTVSLVPVRRVTVTPDALTFTQGDAGTQVAVALLDSIGGALSLTGRPVTWSSNRTSVATVNSTGFVTPVGPGQAVITATQTGSGLSATTSVTVTQVPVASVVIAPDLDTLIVGQAVQLAATTKDASGNTLTGRAIVWDGSDDAVGSVSSAGRVTALSPGTLTATATSEGKVGTSTIVVLAVPVASVVISPTSASVVAGSSTSAFTAVAKDGSGNVLNGRTFAFASSNTAVATIDASTGVATGVAPGTTTITATSEGVTSNNATLTVSAVPVASVTIAPTTQSVVAGDVTPAFTAVTKDGSGNVLTGRSVTFASSNTSVATINATTGVATGVAAGTASITATSEGKTSPAATLTVSPAPVGSVIVSPISQSVVEGATTPAFTAVTKDGHGNVVTGRAVTFASSNPAVATISSTSGVATGVDPGTTSITATSEGKTSPPATLTVSAAPVASVTISPTTQTVVDGQSTPAFTAVTRDAGGNVLTGRAVTFASSNTSVATINAAGVATGQSPGTSSITATSEGKTSPGATLTVSAVPVASVVLSPTSQTVVDGSNTPAFTAVTKDGSGNTLTGRAVTFASSNPSVATINTTTGVATGQSPGTTTITASSEGKTSNGGTLTVSAVPVATVTISPTSQSVVDGASTPAFTAVTRDGSGNVLTGRVVTFASSDPSVATINASSGVATGASPGTTTITASSEGQTSPAATLTVTPVPVNNVVVAPSSQAVDVGSTVTFVATPRDASNAPLSGRTIVYSSSDPTIASINSSTGVATGVAPGSVTIGALSEGKTGTASLTVNPAAVGSVTVAPSSQSVVAGSTTSSPFVATVRDGSGNVLTGRVVTFQSSDNTIATVDNSGNATGVAAGSVTITATSEGHDGTASLTVTAVPVASVDMSPALATIINSGGTVQFTATPRDAGGTALTGRTITWTSSDPGTATVDANGLIRRSWMAS